MIKSEFFDKLSDLYSGFKEKDSNIFDDILDLYNKSELDVIWNSIYYDSFTYKPRPCDIKNRADSIGIVKSFTVDDGKYYYKCLKCESKISVNSHKCFHCKEVLDSSNSILVKCAKLPENLWMVNSGCQIKTCEIFKGNQKDTFGVHCKYMGERRRLNYCEACLCQKCCRGGVQKEND